MEAARRPVVGNSLYHEKGRDQKRRRMLHNFSRGEQSLRRKNKPAFARGQVFIPRWRIVANFFLALVTLPSLPARIGPSGSINPIRARPAGDEC
jgi:hypothetical protein